MRNTNIEVRKKKKKGGNGKRVEKTSGKKKTLTKSSIFSVRCRAKSFSLGTHNPIKNAPKMKCTPSACVKNEDIQTRTHMVNTIKGGHGSAPTRNQ